ncbi:MAG: hypothetical protein E6J41_03225 [Chloroflexi bacterium]|nr:MAG: hypothetical protein E6J41_03225 [Chloroflexota bacterium]
MTPTGPATACLTVLLIDDAETQSERIQDCLRDYAVWVEWRPSYRAAAELLHDPDRGQLIDLILIDQDFTGDAVPPEDLLTRSEVGGLTGTDDWDVRLHQGLFVMARLGQDMREGRIPFAPMMILTHYARVDIAGQVSLGGYESKRRLITDPYTALKGYLAAMRPTEVDVDRRLADLRARLDLPDELTAEIRRAVLGGLDLEETSAAVGRLTDPTDWRAVGRSLERLAERRRTYSVERLARTIEGAWLASQAGWLRVGHVEPAGPLDREFDAFQVEICQPGTTFPALLAARALPPEQMPATAQVSRGFRMLRATDGRSRPVRLHDAGWTILGCWVARPERWDTGPGAAARRLLGVTRHVRHLHGRGLAHGSLSVLSTGYEPPVFGAIRCLAGACDAAQLRLDDLRQLPALAVSAFGEDPAPAVRAELARWAACVDAGDLDGAERVLEAADLRDEAPAYLDFDSRLYCGGEQGFRDRLLASLGAEDAVLREVRCDEVSASPLDFVVCAAGAVAVLEHRTRLRRVVLGNGDVAGVEADAPESEDARCRRSLARCRRSADALAARVEAAMDLGPGSVRRLAALVVAEGTVVEPGYAAAWRPVVTEAEAVSELVSLSRAGRSPRGVDMARYVSPPSPPDDEAHAGRRALHWTTLAFGPNLTRMRTWRKQWPARSWRHLLTRLATARLALRPPGDEAAPLRLVALRAYDDDGRARDVAEEAEAVDVVEYDLRMPGETAPLATYFGDAGSEAVRRRMAAQVLRSLLCWERCRLAYRTMGPDGLVYAGGIVHFDLLQSVSPPDVESRWRMRLGAAASLVFLLSPWPHAWPAVLGGTTPALPVRPDEGSAWGIAAGAVAVLLDPDAELGRLEATLYESVQLLDAAALLDHRFPAWPAGLAREALS